MEKYAIQMIGITKTFPGVVANDNVTLQVYENEILALLGENGAGKSTLMSVLFGAYTPDKGEIYIHGKKVHIKDTNSATQLGIGMVHQHFKLVHNYTVAENIMLGMESINTFGFLNLKKAEKRVSELSQEYGLKVNASDKIEDISVAMQQRVEILKTLYRNADIIIFDEPTAVLTPQEIDELMEIIKRLKAEGKTIIIITHKLQEIKAVAERCTVLRRGRLIDTVLVKEVSKAQLAEMMVGRAVNFNIDKKPAHSGEVVLSVKNISVKNSRGQYAVRNLSLDLRAGEILGIAGVDGNGQTELIYALSGLSAVSQGSIFYKNKDITHATIRERIELGIAHIPEDRQKHGIVPSFTVAENISLKDYYLPPYSKTFGVLSYPEMNNRAHTLIDAFDIRAGEGSFTLAGNMSGGNQQKLIVAREISLNPDVLIIAQPTRGLDVGAIEYIRMRIIQERDRGKAILLISLELDEITNLCDRIAAISKGSIAGVFNAGDISQRELGIMMTGEKKEAHND